MIYKNPHADKRTDSGKPLWYAIMEDRNDDDWGYGSFSFQEAARKVLECGGDAYIAVIDGDLCIDEIDIPTLHELADNEISGLRKLTGLKRKDFCDRYGIPYRTMQDWETGKSDPPEYVQILLERAVRQDQGLQSTYYVYSIYEYDEFVELKTQNKLEAIKRASRERDILAREGGDAKGIEIRLYAHDIEDEDCTCFDYNPIEF